MELDQVLPIWQKLTTEEQRMISEAASLRTVAEGTLLHAGGQDCMGFC